MGVSKLSGNFNLKVKFKGHGGGRNSGERKKYFSNDLRSLAKPVEFGQTLPVYFTACSSSYSLFTMEQFIEFYFELGLK